MHVDIAQIHTAEGKGYLFVAIDRKTRYVFAELYPSMDAKTTATFLKNVISSEFDRDSSLFLKNSLLKPSGPCICPIKFLE